VGESTPEEYRYMQETVEQYKQRILGYLGDLKPLQVQAATPTKIERLIKKVSRATLTKRPAPGKWSAVEILAHLADQWKHFGIHSERGEESIERIVRMFAGHDLNHLRQVEAIVAPRKKGPARTRVAKHRG
jgi:hypothetical protein